MLSALLLATTILPHPQAGDPRRDFDFWAGEWSVQNRHLQDDGSWKEGTRTRARITPVCAGAALLEEWAGPFRQSFMNGFSLRAWDPDAEAWVLLLMWTTDGNGTFGQLSGRFRHGRGEFFAPATGLNRTRYTFSDALARSVRWDSARTVDGGQHWRTDWIMEFSRTRAAAETTQARLFEVPWNEGVLAPQPEARALDWMLGEWSGVQVDASGRECEANLQCTLLNKDCLVLDLLRTREQGTEEWQERLTVRGYESQNGAWAGWRVSQDDSRLRRARGKPSDDAMLFEGADPDTPGSILQEYLLETDGDRMQIEEARVEADGSQTVLRSTSLERVK